MIDICNRADSQDRWKNGRTPRVRPYPGIVK